MDAPRPTSDGIGTAEPDWPAMYHAAVARVTDLEAQLRDAQSVSTSGLVTRLMQRAEAAEAQVAALTHQIECADTPLMRDVLAAKLAAEAALATTRQALAEIAALRYSPPSTLCGIARRALAAINEGDTDE